MKDIVIFDLDGTLVDSADGILASFTGAFSACGRTPVLLPLSPDIIGPPLLPTLCTLAGCSDERSGSDFSEPLLSPYDRISC